MSYFTPEWSYMRSLIMEGASSVFEAFYPTFEFPEETEDDNTEFSTGL